MSWWRRLGSPPVGVSLEVCGLAVGNIVGHGSGLLE